MFNEDRYGKVSIHQDILRDETEVIANIVFKDCIVVRAEHMLMTGCVEYVIYSPDFDILTGGETLPVYVAQMTKTPTDDPEVMHYSRRWERQP